MLVPTAGKGAGELLTFSFVTMLCFTALLINSQNLKIWQKHIFPAETNGKHWQYILQK